MPLHPLRRPRRKRSPHRSRKRPYLAVFRALSGRTGQLSILTSGAHPRPYLAALDDLSGRRLPEPLFDALLEGMLLGQVPLDRLIDRDGLTGGACGWGKGEGG